MRCFKCGKTTQEAGSLYRVNEKGQPGIFGCLNCLPKEKIPDEDLHSFVSIIEKENKILH